MLTVFKTESYNVILCFHGVVVTTIKIVATEITADNFFFQVIIFGTFSFGLQCLIKYLNKIINNFLNHYLFLSVSFLGAMACKPFLWEHTAVLVKLTTHQSSSCHVLTLFWLIILTFLVTMTLGYTGCCCMFIISREKPNFHLRCIFFNVTNWIYCTDWLIAVNTV